MNAPTHRHMGDVKGLAPHSPSSPGARVNIRCGPGYAESQAGQHLLWMLMNVLARQFYHIDEIGLEVPDVPVRPNTAHFGFRPTLRDTLIKTGTAIAEPPTAILPEPIQQADVEIHVGPGNQSSSHGARLVRVSASGWKMWFGSSPVGHELDDANPLGPYFAACIAGGEVFKYVRGVLPGKGCFLDASAMCLWDWTSDLASPAPRLDGLVLPPTYVIGVGAVGQAACAALASLPKASGHLTVIDQDPVDDTNLNRYCLSARGDAGTEKVAIVSARLSSSTLSIFPVVARWPDYAHRPGLRDGQRTDLRTLEDQYLYEHVLSCVDKNRPRHEIQNFWPKHLLGGSTNGLMLAVANYDARGDGECLKCHNPIELSAPTREALAAELLRLPREVRAERAKAVDADGVAVEAYLKNPQCGTVGEAEILKFSPAPQSDWSVSFVSIASGTLLAAQHVRRVLLGNAAFPPDQGNTFRYSFLNGRIRRTVHKRRVECDCGQRGAKAYARQWG